MFSRSEKLLSIKLIVDDSNLEICFMSIIDHILKIEFVRFSSRKLITIPFHVAEPAITAFLLHWERIPIPSLEMSKMHVDSAYYAVDIDKIQL